MKEETPSVVNIQHQIRANASQLQDYFSDLYEWEKTINKDDNARQRASKTSKPSVASTAVPRPRTARYVGIDTDNKANAKKSDAHTYDKGYKRWEKFDVTATTIPNVQAVVKSASILPKLPKKAPTTSYEFGRVWKTFALRGDSEQRSRLTDLRADYLRMVDPSELRTVFKTGIESDVLCEIFYVFRHAMLSPSGSDAAVSEDIIAFVLEFASELTKVSRFNMTIMLLLGSEKEDMLWVITRMELLVKDDSGDMANLKQLYELP
ncbi:hypothetical protein BBO99_00002982 [Phytophthora kernoviae]|uniref:RNA-polymerase II-associated protein 3-like C-terminal domain-containing protein n=2 Tax=Phytophthora kernoviae TaxID=325452 RepID=A0A3R7FWK4_9STRA|nr:hypothetical protein G195_003294 [Phytophthora kernoviae 00238/432]KAG2526547.1 hypothetical protein JM16_002718 [Phytophthora kernoviae]KAG2528137.1 hypothetical protein JM18_003378 [Phytophthora kernoviae]RLN02510.1 hypothetical protein BBI17_003100 [Phytophthora kernoviae]RLN82363.1 hypothetical protein BBO99_00002982 [Phytophthora kernoviae]